MLQLMSKHPAQLLGQNTPETHPSLSMTLTKSALWAGGTESTSFFLLLDHRHNRRHLRAFVSINVSISLVHVLNRVRLYSVKTFKPLGTLDYHKNGIQALAFARNVLSTSLPSRTQSGEGEVGSRSGATPALVGEGDGTGDDDEDGEFSDAEVETRKRWLAAGGKDGRISVWELMDFAKPKP